MFSGAIFGPAWIDLCYGHKGAKNFAALEYARGPGGGRVVRMRLVWYCEFHLIGLDFNNCCRIVIRFKTKLIPCDGSIYLARSPMPLGVHDNGGDLPGFRSAVITDLTWILEEVRSYHIPAWGWQNFITSCCYCCRRSRMRSVYSWGLPYSQHQNYFQWASPDWAVVVYRLRSTSSCSTSKASVYSQYTTSTATISA